MGWRSIETASWYLMADEDELGDRVGKAIRGKDGFRRIQQGYLFESPNLDRVILKPTQREAGPEADSEEPSDSDRLP